MGPAIEVGMYSPLEALNVFNTAFNALLNDKNLDSLIVVFFGLYRSFPMFEVALSNVNSLKERALKPILFSISGDKEATSEITKLLEGSGFPVYPDVTRAVRAMSAMREYYVLNRA